MADPFLSPAAELSTLQKFGRGLGAFGAGVGGRGPEFIAGLEAKEGRLSLERQRAAAEDLRRARLMLDAGDLTGVQNLASERIQAIQELGGDPSNTVEFLGLTNAALGGDATALRNLDNEINLGLQEAAEAGVIDKPQAPTPLSPPGKIVADIRAGFLPKGTPTTEPSARDTRVNDLMQTFNLDRPTALAVSENKIDVIPGTAPGEFTLVSSIPGFSVDQITQAAEPPALTPQAAPALDVVTPPPPADITGGINILEEGTGPFDRLAGFLERVPILSEIVSGEDEREATLILEGLGKDFQRAFANNPRFAIGEMQNIAEKIAPAAGALSTPQALGADLKAARRLIENRVAEARTGAQDVSLQPGLREADQSIVNNGERFIRAIDQILASGGQDSGAAPTITTQEEFDALPSGAVFIEDGQRFEKP